MGPVRAEDDISSPGADARAREPLHRQSGRGVERLHLPARIGVHPRYMLEEYIDGVPFSVWMAGAFDEESVKAYLDALRLWSESIRFAGHHSCPRPYEISEISRWYLTKYLRHVRYLSSTRTAVSLVRLLRRQTNLKVRIQWLLAQAEQLQLPPRDDVRRYGKGQHRRPARHRQDLQRGLRDDAPGPSRRRLRLFPVGAVEVGRSSAVGGLHQTLGTRRGVPGQRRSRAILHGVHGRADGDRQSHSREGTGAATARREKLESSKSVYYPVELSQVIERIRAQEGRSAVVGVPCFVRPCAC